MKLGIILQARMGSTRLPGKVLLDVFGKSLIENCIAELSLLKLPIVVAIPLGKKDILLFNHLLNIKIKYGIEIFQGSELDVLDRFYQATLKYNFDAIIRATGDNPRPNIKEANLIIDKFKSESLDYINNFEGALAKGEGLEVISKKALILSKKNGTKAHHLEHVNEYILENPDLFNCYFHKPNSKNTGTNLSIDTKVDLLQVSALVQNELVSSSLPKNNGAI